MVHFSTFARRIGDQAKSCCAPALSPAARPIPFIEADRMPKKGQATWRAQAREAPRVDPNLNPTDVEDPGDALTMAAMQGNEGALATLLDAGNAPVDGKDAIGVAPLHWAAFCGQAGICAALISAGADVHVRDQEGRTPLHVAAYESHHAVISKLVAAGADVMAPDKMGWTPLHCAVSNGEEDACRQLTEAGADPTSPDLEGKTAFDLAKHFGNTQIISVLEGANVRHEARCALAARAPMPSARAPTPPLATPCCPAAWGTGGAPRQRRVHGHAHARWPPGCARRRVLWV